MICTALAWLFVIALLLIGIGLCGLALVMWLVRSEYLNEIKRAEDSTPTYLDEATDRISPSSPGDTGDGCE